MKGGITSGVVYPPAVCELASKYLFRNIGGTSGGSHRGGGDCGGGIGAAPRTRGELRPTSLDMPPEVVDKLTKRGESAGRKLRDDFSWPNHVWVRYRSTMANLEIFVSRVRVDYRHSTLLREFLSSEPAPSYPMESAQRDAAWVATEELSKASEVWDTQGQSFSHGEPRPPSVLRSTPRV